MASPARASPPPDSRHSTSADDVRPPLHRAQRACQQPEELEASSVASAAQPSYTLTADRASHLALPSQPASHQQVTSRSTVRRVGPPAGQPAEPGSIVTHSGIIGSIHQHISITGVRARRASTSSRRAALSICASSRKAPSHHWSACQLLREAALHITITSSSAFSRHPTLALFGHWHSHCAHSNPP